MGRRAAIDHASDLRDEWEQSRLKTANLRNEVVEYFDRAVAAANRARASQAAGASAAARKAPPQPETPAMSESDYKAHLGKGGQILPEVEAALGLNT